jgi:adenosylhomocysteinase
MCGTVIGIRNRIFPWLLPLSLEKTSSGREYKVKDMSQADFGRIEIHLAEAEMPGLMACREEFDASQPLRKPRSPDLSI